jgi:hypothetical protein
MGRSLHTCFNRGRVACCSLHALQEEKAIVPVELRTLSRHRHSILHTGNGSRAHPVHSIAACRHLAKRWLGPSGSDGALDVTCRIGKVAAQFENGDLPIDPQEEVRFIIQTYCRLFSSIDFLMRIND